MTVEAMETIQHEAEGEMESVATRVLSNVQDLETLEIYMDQNTGIHLAFRTEKSENIASLVSFLENTDPNIDPEEGIRQSLCKSEFIYKGHKYTFNRVAALTEYYISIILISRDEIDGAKRGMILLIDSTGVVFIATCKSEALRKFNLEFVSTLYPDL